MKILRTTDQGTFFDETLLRHIQSQNNDELLSIVIAQKVDVCQLRDSSRTTLLHFAAHYDNEDCAQFLIASGVKVDAQNQFGDTPLMFAVEANKEATARLLLKNDANLFLPNILDQCALGRALSNYRCDAPYRKIITLLLDSVTVDSLQKNIDHVRSETFHRDCELYHFVSMGNVAITRILLESGSSVNAKHPRTEETALHVSAARLDLEHVKLLLEWKANVNAKSRDGRTPLACIFIQYQEDRIRALAIMKILIAAGAQLIDRSSRKIMASSLLSQGNRDIVHALIQNRIDLAFRDEIGRTPLHYLSTNSYPDVFEELNGLDFDVKLRNGHPEQTMLHLAAKAGNPSSVKFLVDRGADVDALDNGRNTPLSYVIQYALCIIGTRTPYRIDHTTGRVVLNHSPEPGVLKDYADCAEILLESGVDPQIFTTENQGIFIYDESTTLAELKNVITPVLAHLALHEMSGRPINRHMRSQIEKYHLFETIFNSAKLQFEEIKRVNIGVSVTLLDFAFASDERISLYARNKMIVCDLTVKIKEYCSDLYYHRKLQEQHSKFTRLAEMRDRVAAFISEIFSQLCNVPIDTTKVSLLWIEISPVWRTQIKF